MNYEINYKLTKNKLVPHVLLTCTRVAIIEVS